VPIYITENGIGTEDDTRRVEYIQRALAGVRNSLAAGIDVRRYIHWSLLDNFEWIFEYRPEVGLISVDRQTQNQTELPLHGGDCQGQLHTGFCGNALTAAFENTLQQVRNLVHGRIAHPPTRFR